jgi:hypothetical protein
MASYKNNYKKNDSKEAITDKETLQCELPNLQVFPESLFFQEHKVSNHSHQVLDFSFLLFLWMFFLVLLAH